jgi:hypothetical protein
VLPLQLGVPQASVSQAKRAARATAVRTLLDIKCFIGIVIIIWEGSVGFKGIRLEC